MPGDATVEAAGFAETQPAGGSLLRFDRTDQPGVYRLAEAPSKAGRVPDASRAVAVNVDTAESDPAVWSAAQLAALFGERRCEVVPPDAPVETVVLASQSGREIWPAIATLLLVVLLVETLLAYRFSFQKASTAPATPAVTASTPAGGSA